MIGNGTGQWLDDDDPWLVLSRGLELTDLDRGNTLTTAWTGRTDDLVNDRDLHQRYQAVGIEHVFLVWAVVDPDARPGPPSFRRRGNQLFVKADFPDDQGRPLGEAFDAWLEPRVRSALTSYKQLATHTQD